MEQKGCLCRIRSCAVELFSAMEEDLDTADESSSWDLVGRDLRLKAAFLCIDLGRVIALCEGEERKKALTALANKLFYSMDEVRTLSPSLSLSFFLHKKAYLGPLQVQGRMHVLSLGVMTIL